MVTVKPIADNNLLLRCATEQLGCPHFCSQVGRENVERSFQRYYITASEIKVIRGRRKFLAQLNSDRSMDGSQDLKKHKMCHQEDVLVFEQTKHCEELLFCITNGDKADSELIPAAAVPNDAILIVINVNPIEYGHVFLVPHGFDRLDQVLDARFLEMVVRVAVEINNCSFRLFYNCPRHSRLYFQAQTFSTPCNLSAWECGGYFLFKSRQEFDEVTEAVLLKRLSTVSLYDEGFATVKELCCRIACEIAF
ncbi:hypothetical protein GH714_016993 [Hevea brasiliensis]|uniref:GDPGP1-like N-terminal domain-containing protein n=1 Tax=Hevea brasiliensis TaxID=3981 RepID=A0A6A6ME47_HEVBR|nr:hypothetical protein GH714_016993 [Hevea brasiliensis]